MGKTTTKTLLLTTMTLLLSACATADATAQAVADPCGKLYKPNKPRLTLQLDEFGLELTTKKRMCLIFDGPTKKSGTFEIDIGVGNSGYTYAPDREITVEGKSTATDAPGISGKNSAAHPYVISVTVNEANVPPTHDADYDYWIKVPGVGVLDPKVRVIRQSNPAPLWAQDVEAALQDLGLTLEDIGLDREELERLLGEKFEAQQL